MDIREVSIGLLISVAAVDMSTGAKEDLFTVPVGKKCIVTHVVVRSASGALGADNDFGDGADATTWLQTVNLSTVAANEYFVIESNNIAYTIFDAGDVFGVKKIAGTAETATIDIFGYMYNA